MSKVYASSGWDCHHIFYCRKSYKTKTLRDLREFPYCKVYIPKDTVHKTLHALVRCVPAPKEVNAKGAMYQLRLLEEYGAISPQDSLEKRVEVLAALFDCVEQPTADALREQARIVHEHKKAPRA